MCNRSDQFDLGAMAKIDFQGLCECFFEPLRKLFAELVGLARIVLRSFPLEYVEGQFLERR